MTRHDLASADRVAVFVDGDNVQADHAGAILRTSAAYGRAAVQRVYGNLRQMPRWDAVPGFRLVHSGGGKNATDLLIAIDVMELAARREVATFVIVSSDRDFAHLAARLREHMFTVVGIGEAKAPAGFRLSCTRFQELPALVPAEPLPAARPAQAPTALDLQIRAMIAERGRKGLGLAVTELSIAMHDAHGFRIGSTPYRSWRAYLVAKPALYDLDPRGPEACVRVRPAGFAVAPA